MDRRHMFVRHRVQHTRSPTLRLLSLNKIAVLHMEFWNLASKQRQFAMWTRRLSRLCRSALRQTSHSPAHELTAWIACKSVMCKTLRTSHLQDRIVGILHYLNSQTQDSIIYLHVFCFCFRSRIYLFILMNMCDTFCRFAFCSHLLAWNKSNYNSTIRKKKVCSAPFLKISFSFFRCFHSIFAVAVCVNMNGSHVTWHATNHGTKHDVHISKLKIAEKEEKNQYEQKYNYAFANATTFHESNWRYWHAFFAVCFISRRCSLDCHLFMAVGLSSSEYVTNWIPIARFWHSWRCPNRRISALADVRPQLR